MHWMPAFWIVHHKSDPFHILWENMYGKRVEVFIYGISNLIIYIFCFVLFCWCLSVTLAEKHQMIIRRKKNNKGKKKIDFLHSSVWPWWHNSLEERPTWIVYPEAWVSWCSKCRYCKAVWTKTPSHFNPEAIVLHKQFCGLDLIPYTFFLYLLPAQEPAQIATVLLPANSSGKQGHVTGVHIC